MEWPAAMTAGETRSTSWLVTVALDEVAEEVCERFCPGWSRPTAEPLADEKSPALARSVSSSLQIDKSSPFLDPDKRSSVMSRQHSPTAAAGLQTVKFGWTHQPSPHWCELSAQ